MSEPRELSENEWNILEPLFLDFRRAKAEFDLVKAKMDHQVELFRLDCGIPDNTIFDTDKKIWMRVIDAQRGVFVKLLPEKSSQE